MSELKKEFKEKLIALGIYDAWLYNFNSQNRTINSISYVNNWSNFIAWSFSWGVSREGCDFWDQISKQ